MWCHRSIVPAQWVSLNPLAPAPDRDWVPRSAAGPDIPDQWTTIGAYLDDPWTVYGPSNPDVRCSLSPSLLHAPEPENV